MEEGESLLTANVYEGSYWDDVSVLKLDCGDVFTTFLNLLKTIALYIYSR